MRRGELLVEQIVDLIVVDFKVAALDYEDSIFKSLTLINLTEEVLQTVYKYALIFHLLDSR